jgi:hypothetical protein
VFNPPLVDAFEVPLVVLLSPKGCRHLRCHRLAVLANKLDEPKTAAFEADHGLNILPGNGPSAEADNDCRLSRQHS